MEWDYTFAFHFEVQADMVISEIKNAMYKLHLASAECLHKLKLVYGTGSNKEVVAKTKVKKGEVELVAVTTSVACTKGGPKDKVPPSCLDLGLVFQHPRKHRDVHAYMSQKFQKPSEDPLSSNPVPEFIALFWLVQSTSDMNLVNMVLHTHDVKTESGKLIHVPAMVNTKAISAGEPLKYYKAADAQERWPMEPPLKKARVT